MKKPALILIGFLILLLCTSCLAREVGSTNQTSGFLLGIWHGWIAPFALIARLFDPSVRIYDASNSGWWYEFGFYIAIISGFGTLSLFRKRNTSKNHR
ncbi:MAG: hypothetical protein EOM15_00170 [Spirochaetia bacterium]|nr:hypothetical protein [Spirochaetia bacterium]